MEKQKKFNCCCGLGLVCPTHGHTKNRGELYFTTYLTENEHYIVEDLIETACKKLGLVLVYYRKFKNGHVPMYRECKIQGDVSEIKDMLRGLDINYENANENTHIRDKKYKKWMIK